MSHVAQMSPPVEPNDIIPTRRSSLSRLKDWRDNDSWEDFFETYWRLIYNAAIRAGLSDAEGQDVVQETIISVSKSMPDFKYDPKIGSFKGWLLKLTRWRITDQFRKRQRGLEESDPDNSTSTRTATVENLPDPAGDVLEATWDEEWDRNFLQAAIARIKKRVDSKHYQAFDLCVFKQWPVSKVARALKINIATVYVIKHRIGKQIKKELEALHAQPLDSALKTRRSNHDNKTNSENH